MNNNPTVSISKSRFTIMWIALVALSVALLISVLRPLNAASPPPPPPPTKNEGAVIRDPGKPVPLDEPKIKKFVERFDKILFMDSQARVRIVNTADGVDVPVCGRVDGTKWPATCPGNDVDIRFINQITVFELNEQKNPCTLVWGELSC